MDCFETDADDALLTYAKEVSINDDHMISVVATTDNEPM